MTRAALRGMTIVTVLLSCAAIAHEGHDDDDDAATPAAKTATPAAALAADTPQVELVLKRQQADVLLYLDDYATDAPLDGLQVEVHSGSRMLQAAAAGEGLYRVPADLLDGLAGSSLQVVVHGRGIRASVPGELPPAPVQTVAPGATRGLRLSVWPWATIAAVTLLSLLLFRLRHRRRTLAA